jgi:hypothetical protein
MLEPNKETRITFENVLNYLQRITFYLNWFIILTGDAQKRPSYRMNYDHFNRKSVWPMWSPPTSFDLKAGLEGLNCFLDKKSLPDWLYIIYDPIETNELICAEGRLS